MSFSLKEIFDRERPIIIDGGLSNVLESKGCDLNHKLWTAKLIIENPELLIETHLEYVNAGAQVIATASYQATLPGLLKEGYSSKEAKSILLKSVELAQEAIRRSQAPHEKTPLIAASIGPYGAYLADGSEYKGNYTVSKKVLIDFHEERMAIFNNSAADIIAIETIPSLIEAEVLSELLNKFEKPAWISFSCKDEGHINDGSPIEKVISLFEEHPTVFAVGVNCTHPKYISGLIRKLKESTNKKLLVYPNSGEAYNAKTKEWLGLSEPLSFAEMAKEWISLGADMIGGCCRIGPKHIKELTNQKPK